MGSELMKTVPTVSIYRVVCQRGQLLIENVSIPLKGSTRLDNIWVVYERCLLEVFEQSLFARN